MSGSAKQIVALSAIVLLALLLTGLVTGAIGSAVFGGEDADPVFVEQPSPHIPPQKLSIDKCEDKTTHEYYAPTDGECAAGDKAKYDITEKDGFVITNTLLSSWFVSLLLIALFFFGTRRMETVPRGLQNFVEFAVEALYGFVQSVAGNENGRRFFPLIGTIFFFVLLNAWVGLLPFYPTLGYDAKSFLFTTDPIHTHLLRPAGTDLNMPLALALASFVFVEYWGIRMLGVGYFGKFVRLENLRKGNFLQVPIDIFVGVLELLSEFVRIVSFTFRLFGNMTAGEILLLVITYLVPFVAVVVFYGLELLVGIIQALIFAGLTLVFVVLAVTPHSEEEH
ncbi:MAG: F0F1 ATP synthase subunit A [Chloroflexota bacterium]|nr:F0F1 ATP synthase subunit A [Chloroflexota bacterium]MDE2942052.1 F0F1 ATP synthase subunit A [Chloroflexota bacterium]MDE3267276.1 F0F1 ATP synthase subunit A [Chloroflexota bacterium]